MIISLLGLHGCGKSTQSKLLKKFLISKGYKSRIMNIQSFSFYSIIKKIFKISNPQKGYKLKEHHPCLVRIIIYFIDILLFNFWFFFIRDRKVILILDRSFLDRFANLDLSNRFLNSMVGILNYILIKPNLSIYLYIDPMVSYNRNPEYSYSYFLKLKESYDLFFERGYINDKVICSSILFTQKKIQDLIRKRIF